MLAKLSKTRGTDIPYTERLVLGKAHMSRFRSLVVSASMLVASGCGGGGSAHHGGIDPYEGTYAGNFEDNAGDIGTVNLKVANDGTVTGNGAPSSGSTVTLSGYIYSSGAVSITSTNSSNTTTQSGTASSAAGSTVYTTLSDSSGDVTWVNLVRNPAYVVGGGQFAGQYSGLILNNTKGKTGIIAFAVDNQGNVSGSVLVSDGGTPTFGYLAGTLSTSGALQYTVTINGSTYDTVSGTASISGGTLTTSGLTSSLGDSLSITATDVS